MRKHFHTFGIKRIGIGITIPGIVIIITAIAAAIITNIYTTYPIRRIA